MVTKFRLQEDPHTQVEEIKLELGRLEQGAVIEIDFAELNLLDSMLLGQILKVFLLCRDRGIEFRLRNVHDHARWVIHNANLDEVFGMPSFKPPSWDSDATSF